MLPGNCERISLKLSKYLPFWSGPGLRTLKPVSNLKIKKSKSILNPNPVAIAI
jgi:hypothetical protein